MAPISEFLADYTREKSRKARITALRRFLSFIYDGIDIPVKEGGRLDLASYEPWAERYLNEVREKKRDHVADLRRFKNSLEDLAPYSSHNYLAGVVMFLEYHKFPLTPDERKRIRRGSPPKQTLTADAALTPEHIQKILTFSPPALKALIMVLASSGLRLGEALALRMSDVDTGTNPVRIYVRKEIAKTKLPRVTFITSETAPVLMDWLKYRPEYIRNKNGPRIYKVLPENEPRLFPFNIDATEEMFTYAVKKAGLHKVDRNTGKATIHLHSFRKWFRSNLARAGGNASDVSEKLMGHIHGLNPAYVRISPEELARFYQENEHFLFIYRGMSVADREKVKNLADENNALREEIENMKTQLAFMRSMDKQAVGLTPEELARLRALMAKMG